VTTGQEATVKICGVTVVILSFSVDHGFDLRCGVVDGVLDAAD
jgi:hypothetical protein